jgi:hypothetical protein
MVKEVYEVTVRDVYELALGLMDEPDTNERYLERAVPLLKILQSEVSRVLMWRRVLGGIETPDDEIGLPEEVADSVLPYGLAANLLLESDPGRAAFMEAKYEEELAKAVRRMPSVFEEIANLYGSLTLD